ncbi:class I adenylate-forming enzyme family protein [Hydrogenophaga sp. BPS33]|uniref:class I adenylate-forming enzyme family protein n=1 Tax=Hydrogenophaga sp. BPS33 TaxID=2651974 RepID=UPI00131FB9B1|nr:class I adenylate-forming enzyme family protein [Hydrogenophaga sp. BPS33]QHE84570.1 acyl--CoA ligase [Hydrogenophaga sp. BPS33]
MTRSPDTTAPRPEGDFGLITDLVRAHAAQRPQALALRDDRRTMTYAELDMLMDQVAGSLQRSGAAPGDAIAICATSSVRYAAVFLGALRAGLAVAPLAPNTTPASLARMLQDSAARVLFVDASTAAQTAAGQGLPDGFERIALDPVEGAGDGPRVFEDWLQADALPAPVELRPDSPFNILYSSGTTGEPKGIVQPHGMRWAHVRRVARFEYGPDTVSLLSTPLYSNTTLVTFFPTLAYGGCAVLMAKSDATRFLQLSQDLRATHAMLVPTQYQRLMAHPEFDSYDLCSYRYKFSTSAPFSAALKADVLRRWPGGLVEQYGMTEGGVSCMLEAHLHPDKLHTVGRPIAGCDVRLIDEDGREVAAGMAGEIVGRSAGMMSGYLNLPEKTREAEWFSSAGERFIRTGDIGRFDADGFLSLIDRRKDMIISGGYNIYPSDLEAVLAQHPAVAEAAVVGVASEAWGETPVAFVVLREGGSHPDEAELLAWANARLGKTQRIAALRCVERLPRSEIGKVLKRELRAGFVARDSAISPLREASGES